ncbi:BON domain-containing protein [Hydrogenophaga sp. NFH-34]|uniref:BON domain-containing protein n=1 Tax=Hydrogenophaga sp. NFH-34 TaxID=2744446 RepID=UPI001F1598D7|nr:BON domain-containing protein [Hydrogenophaga sp. NFH-34]
MKTLQPSRLVMAATLAVAAVVTTAGCAVARDQQTVGAYIDDATLTTRVKAKFAEDPTVSALAIKVETLNGVVQLAGFAKSGGERARAEDVARTIHGVKDVKNDIILQN